MTRLYRNNELLFAVVLVFVYLTGTSAAKILCSSHCTIEVVTFIFYAVMSALLFLWVCKNGLLTKYGLCKSNIKSSKFLYYIPLAILSSVNLLFGLKLNMSVEKSFLSVGSIILASFLEEMIFRGFLFCGLAKKGVCFVTLISSLAFGIGHIVNLFNGSGVGISETLCQTVNACAFGYLFVTIFCKSKSLIPCIVSHSIINALSVFSNQVFFTKTNNVILSLSVCIVIAAYCVLIHKMCRTKTQN